MALAVRCQAWRQSNVTLGAQFLLCRLGAAESVMLLQCFLSCGLATVDA